MPTEHFARRCLRVLAGLGLLGLTAARTGQAAPKEITPRPDHFQVKYYGHFSELPVGAVQPGGWIRQWLERQARGLTGHPENMSYPYDTCMYAGVIPPPPHTNQWWSAWWPYEQSGYFVDGLTRLSWLIRDPAINRQRDANLDYILRHSTGGSLGASRWCWPNAVVGRALMAKFSATGDPQVAQVLENALLANRGKITRRRGVKNMFYLYRNGANAEEAFYLYGLTGDQRLLDLGRKVYENYLHDTNSFCSVQMIRNNVPFHEHGVTAAETLKCLSLMYLYTGQRQALRLARRAYQKVVDYSLMPDGGIASSEKLGRSRFDSLHESCDIVDWSWSLGYLFMATGQARWADLIERATFNALPGAVTKDFKQLQYFSAVNQVVIAATNSRVPFCPTRMSYRAAHDTACCAGNINRAMPNYVIRMWMRSRDRGLAAVFYGPSQVTTRVRGQSVTLIEETDYPFRGGITFRVKTAKPVRFNLHCRIPRWCHHATVHINGKRLSKGTPPGTFVSIRRTFRDGDTVRLTLAMPVQIEHWFRNRSVCLTRGPLVFSLKMNPLRVQHFHDPQNIKTLLKGHNIQGFPEVEIYPQSDWRYGFDAALTNELSKIKVVESRVTRNPFVEDQTPVRLEVPLCHLPDWCPGWKPTLTAPAKGPIHASAGPWQLPKGDQLDPQGPLVMKTLVPYGATCLRLTTLPLADKGKGVH